MRSTFYHLIEIGDQKKTYKSEVCSRWWGFSGACPGKCGEKAAAADNLRGVTIIFLIWCCEVWEAPESWNLLLGVTLDRIDETAAPLRRVKHWRTNGRVVAMLLASLENERIWCSNNKNWYKIRGIFGMIPLQCCWTSSPCLQNHARYRLA
jgi:hypothetical protein